jgi:hypothetical protein
MDVTGWNGNGGSFFRSIGQRQQKIVGWIDHQLALCPHDSAIGRSLSEVFEHDVNRPVSYITILKFGPREFGSVYQNICSQFAFSGLSAVAQREISDNPEADSRYSQDTG